MKVRREMEKSLNTAKSFKHHSNLLGSRDRSITSRRTGQKRMWRRVKACAEHTASLSTRLSGISGCSQPENGHATSRTDEGNQGADP